MRNIRKEYEDLFGSLPKIPVMCSYSQIYDLMEDAIISKMPLTQEEVNKHFEDMDESYDIEIF